MNFREIWVELTKEDKEDCERQVAFEYFEPLEDLQVIHFVEYSALMQARGMIKMLESMIDDLHVSIATEIISLTQEIDDLSGRIAIAVSALERVQGFVSGTSAMDIIHEALKEIREI